MRKRILAKTECSQGKGNSGSLNNLTSNTKGSANSRGFFMSFSNSCGKILNSYGQIFNSYAKIFNSNADIFNSCPIFLTRLAKSLTCAGKYKGFE